MQQVVTGSCTSATRSGAHLRSGLGLVSPPSLLLAGWLVLVGSSLRAQEASAGPSAPGAESPVASTSPAESAAPPAGPEAFLADPVILKLQQGETESALFAQTFLTTILDGKPEAIEYRKLLLQALEPSGVTRSPGRIVVAVHLISGMNYLASNGRPFPEGAGLLVPLIGTGPENLRKAVTAALIRTLQTEKKTRPESAAATIQAIGARLTTNDPPSREVLQEASEILWPIDGKALLTFLVEGLLKNQAASGEAAPETIAGYVIQIRERYRLEPDDPANWASWWESWKAASLESILHHARDQDDARRLQLWKRNLQRLRETGDPGRLLGALRDTIIYEKSRPIRVASIADLGQFSLWVRGGLGNPRPPAPAEQKKHLGDSVRFLLEVLRGHNGFRFVSLEEKTAAIEALATYGETLNEDPPLRQEVIETVSQILASPQAPGGPHWDVRKRKFSLGLIQLVGALRLTDPRIQDVLVKTLRERTTSEFADPQWVTEAVRSLGRVLGPENAEEAIQLILEVHDRATGKAEQPWLDLRKACIVALNLPISGAHLPRVRELYRKILQEKLPSSERIPAIIGLGILARGGDDASIELLIEALRQRSQLEVGEVSSIINALAYLGGEPALDALIEFLDDEDAALADQVWKRTVGLAKAEDGKHLDGLVDRLEEAAFRRDRPALIRILVKLTREPGLLEHFKSETVAQSPVEIKKRFYLRELARLRAHEMLGELDVVVKGLETLKATLGQHPDLAAELPEAPAALKLLEERVRLKSTARDLASKSPDSPAAEVLKAWLAPFGRFNELAPEVKEGTLSGVELRWQLLEWLMSQVAELKPAAATRKLVDDLLARFASPEGATLLEGLPAGTRTRLQAFLEAHKARLQKS